MEATPRMRARPMAELLPELGNDILSKECKRVLTAKKSRPEIPPNNEGRSTMKPLTMAQLRSELLALQVVKSPKRSIQVNRSTRKKPWNSSVKVDKKTISHTENKQLKKIPARKVLDFQPPTISLISQKTHVSDSINLRKPEYRVMTSIALQDILSKECKRVLTAKKSRPEIPPNNEGRSTMKPLTMAQLRSELLALQVKSSKRSIQVNRSTRNKPWNSSVKVDKKTISHTENKQLKKIPARKVLDFQPPTISLISRKTHVSDSINLRKPESRVMKSIALQGGGPRISGICSISETPFVTKQIKSRMSIANKENVASQNNIKKPLPPVAPSHKKLAVTISDTPISNMSWKSSCDASFLQAEKEVNDFEEKTKALTEEQTLDKLDDISPPASTPFRDNRSIKDLHNNPCDIKNSVICHDDTIMNFDNSAKDIRRDDSVIVSLCSLLNKVTVKSPSINTELDQLMQIEKVIEQETKLIENTFVALKNMKNSHITVLKSIKKLIQKKKSLKNDADKTLIEAKDIRDENLDTKTPATQSNGGKGKAISVIVSTRSPSYKIPKKNISLQKKVVVKSMPNITNNLMTPVKGDMGVRVLSMYTKMKEHMNFLNTPMAKRNMTTMDTPAVTSRNLQSQLDKLYDED